MGNTFKSLVAAAGILAAGDATNAQEGADSTANRTKQALVELLSELPPGFDSARKVIEWDITLAGDGDLSDSDKLAIEGHMWKLATVIPESARKVREAMTGVETIVVVPAPERPILGEKTQLTADERKKQRAISALMESFNESVQEKWTWKRGPQWNQDIEVTKKTGGWISIIYKEEDEDKPDPRWIALVKTQIAPGEYEIEIDATNQIDATKGNAILWITDAGGKCIDSNGVLCEKGKERIKLNPGKQNLTVPPNAATFTIGFEVTPLNPEINIAKIEISPLEKEIIAWN